MTWSKSTGEELPQKNLSRPIVLVNFLGLLVHPSTVTSLVKFGEDSLATFQVVWIYSI